MGNPWAGDDAAGILVARAVRGRLPDGVEVIEHEGEPTALIDAWAGMGLAVVVDATSGGGSPGTIQCLDATDQPLPTSARGRSAHALTLSETIEIARSLGRLPGRLHVVGIEGTSFAAGGAPGDPVAAAIEPATRTVLELLRTNY